MLCNDVLYCLIPSSRLLPPSNTYTLSLHYCTNTYKRTSRPLQYFIRICPIGFNWRITHLLYQNPAHIIQSLLCDNLCGRRIRSFVTKDETITSYINFYLIIIYNWYMVTSINAVIRFDHGLPWHTNWAHGPRDTVDKNWDRRSTILSLLKSEGYALYMAWQTVIKSYARTLVLYFCSQRCRFIFNFP